MKKIILLFSVLYGVCINAQNIGYFNYGQSGNGSWSNHVVNNSAGELVMAGYLQGKPCFVVANVTGAYVTNRVVASQGELFTASIDASDNIYAGGYYGTFGTAKKYVVKYNSAMTKQYGKEYGDGHFRYMINDGSDVVVTGFNTKPCVLKTDASGNIIWYKEYTIDGNDADAYMIHKAGSSYYVTGSLDKGGVTESFVLSVNPANGNVNWCKTYVGGSFSPHFTGMAVSATGIILCGATASSSSGNPGKLSVVKIDFTGNVIWSRLIDNQHSWYLRKPVTMGNSWGIACAIDPYGALVVIGETGQGSDFYSMMTKMNENTGSVIWTKRYGSGGGSPGVNDDGFHGITVSGCTYLASGWMGSAVGSGWDFGLVVSDTSGFAGSSAQCGTAITRTSTTPAITVATAVVTTANLTTANNYAGTNTTATMSRNAICASAVSYSISASSTSICAGSTTTLSVTSGASSYSWTASNPGTIIGSNTTSSVAVNPTVNTTYSCYVGGTTGCVAMLAITVSVTAGAGPTVTVNTATLTCLTNTVSLTATGGGTYSWAGPGIVSGSTTATPIINAGGNYTVTVTAANGCKTTTNTNVSSNNTPPTAGASNSSTLTCTTTTANLTGTGGGTYSWSGPGIVSGGGTANPVVNAPGTYTVLVTAANGCTSTANTSITQNNTPPTAGASNSSTLTCTTPTANLTGTGGGTYSWSGPGIVSGGGTANPVVNAPGTYTVLVTAANGCTATANTSITQNNTPPTAGASNSSTLTCTTTTANLTGTGGGTYSWSGPGIVSGGGTANPVVNAPGTYTVLVTAANGCTATANTTITRNNTPPTAGASNSSTLTCTTPTANLTGTGGGTYSWSGPGIVSGGGTANPVVNAPGTYTVLVTAANGCTATANTTITRNNTPPSPTASSSSSLSCSTTISTLTATGGGTYAWSGPGIVGATNQSTATINAPGTYTVLVTAANGCTATANVIVDQNIAPPTAGASNSSTLTCTTPTANLTGTGGGTYSWSGPGIVSGGGTANPVVNAPGTYTVLVTAANGCTATANTSITQNNTPPTAGASNSSTLTCTTTTANLTGTGGGTYSWSGPGIVSGGGTANPVVNAPGTYTVLVTAANGCTATANTAVAQNTTAPIAGANNSGSITCTTTSVTLTGTGGGTYSWSGSGIVGATNQSTATVNTPGTYSLLVTAANGCTATINTTVGQNTTTPTVNAGPNQSLVCGVSSVTLTGSASAGSTANWLGGVCGSASNFTTTACAPATYTLVATNAVSSCTNSAIVTVSSSTNVPQATINAVTNSITCTNSVVAIGVTLSNSDPVSYSWSGPSVSGSTTTPNTTATAPGTYTVVITNTVTNCQSIYSTVVPSNTTAVTASISPTGSITCAVPTLTLNASPTGGSYTYTWTGSSAVTNANSQNPSISNGGTYSVAITNTVNGCVGNANITVNSNTTTPVVTIAAPSVSTTCSNPTITISASSSPSTGVTYSWTAPSSGSLNQTNVSNPIASGSGIFTVVVTNTASGCSSSLTQNTVSVSSSTAIPTVTLSTNSVSITCTNPTPSATISTSSSPVTYSWSPTSGIVAGTETSATPQFSAAGSYSAVVTNTVSGCSSSLNSAVVNVVLDNTTPNITLSASVNSGTITCTNTVVTISPTVTPTSNLTYTWLPSGVTSSSINDASFSSAGVYTLAVTNTVTGCVSSSTNSANTFTVIVDNTAPTPTIATAPSVTTTCASPDATLSATSDADPNTVYTWTSPTSNTLTGNPIVSPTAGIYTVIVTNTVNGCSTSSASQATVEVVADAGIPTVTLSTNSASITCSNPTPSVTISTSSSPVTYSWSPSAGIVTGTETSATPQFSAAGSYSAVVTNTNSGCASSINSAIVTVVLDNNAPTVTLSSAVNSGTITCTNTVVTISPTVTPTSNLTYTWLPSGVTSSSINDASFTSVGVYTLVVTNTVTGCVTSSTNSANTFTVVVDNAAPSASINVTSANTSIGCGANNATVTLNGSSSSSSNPSPVLTWLPGSVNNSSLDVVSAGDYTLVVVDAVNGCSDSTQITVTGNTNPPQGVDAGTTANIPCGSSTVTLNGVTSTTNTSFSWAGPSATSIISGSNTANPMVGETGDYTLTVTDNATGCSSSAVVNVSQSAATASITADPTSGVSPLTVNFTGDGVGNSFNWNFGDSNSSTQQNPSNVFNTGTYTVTLTVTSGSCTATATVEIVVEDGLTLEIPNVFTPNGDNSNDIFTIKSTGVKNIELQIFNRWGEKLYEFSGAKASWDGKVPNGETAPEGTYFYFVKATGFDDKEIEKHGSVNLFR
jgi:gliding motility-associated-like protein